MASADIVDVQLRTGVRSALQKGIRCLKVSVVNESAAHSTENAGDSQVGDKTTSDAISDDDLRVLALQVALKEEPGQPLDKEFMRCVTKQVEPKKPVLFLFRTDENENLDGSRWLLVSWLPTDAPELQRALHVRSRGLLARLVPQPYFLTELFARDHRQLTWSNVRETCGVMFGGGVGKVTKELAGTAHQMSSAQTTQMVPETYRPEIVPGNKAIAPKKSPTKLFEKSAEVLRRFARGEVFCVRVVLSREDTSNKIMSLDVQVSEAKTAWMLAQAGLPNHDCYFAMHLTGNLLFVLWCPDAPQKDLHRVSEDIRHAAMKASVAEVVFGALPEPRPRLIQIDARDPGDIVDGASGQPIGTTRGSSRSGALARPVAEADLSTVVTGNTFGLHGPAPPQRSPTATIPSSLAFPERPFPPWRGGSKVHTIVTSTHGHGHGRQGQRKGSVSGADPAMKDRGY
eukprot:TRINITY_DN75010_c0_g1_i1.p1 TRINITY_DN75010_c0_g1~~TRINITY_DN75010_c0_g1_i1.p1  ORF type:complete len:457 (+),score=60.66 TRINITY_DN75010_c0_g1_i1:149-1519(+)